VRSEHVTGTPLWRSNGGFWLLFRRTP